MEGRTDEEEGGKSKVNPELAEKFERAIQEALQFLDERPTDPEAVAFAAELRRRLASKDYVGIALPVSDFPDLLPDRPND
jgi:hypothetical protein